MQAHLILSTLWIYYEDAILYQHSQEEDLTQIVLAFHPSRKTARIGNITMQIGKSI